MDHSKIIRMLMQEDYVSGEWMSSRLGVTRAAIWKGIEFLRQQGYDIQSVKKRGYHLEPPQGAVWPVCIRHKMSGTRWAGHEIIYDEEMTSTNLRARELGGSDAQHGTLVLTEHQTHGRGRMTRTWDDHPGDSVLFSLLVRPESLIPAQATALVLIAALAACDACRKWCPDVLIKWPNDLVAGGHKICGMLLEMGADMDQVHFAVIGVGINVRSHPENGNFYAASLEDAAGKPVDRAELIASFLINFEITYEIWRRQGIQSVLLPYRDRSVTLGSEIRAICADGTYQGTAEDITEDGSLIMRMKDGNIRLLRAGDVSVRGIMGYV